jgi:ribosomal protein S18/ribosomal protein S6
MIYELSLVAKSELSAEDISALQALVHEVAKQHDGDILIQDDWGRMEFAQTSKKGFDTGRFLYFLYKANSDNNKELERRMKINEGILKAMIINLGDDEDQDQIVKAYKTPYSKNYNGSVMDEEEEEESDDRPRRRFSGRKNCIFTMKKIKADWKDPKTYEWLVNEFGKVSPARVTGITRKHQRFATTAIKRARQIGLASYMSNRFAEHV